VRERDGWTLVDSGPPEAADQLVSALARATSGRGPSRILLTHAHYDHAGGLEAMRDAWNPALLCHREEVPFVTGELFHSQIRSRRLAFWIGRFLMKEGLWALPVSRDLERGESAAGMAVIHLPGHTPGQVGFLHPTDHAFICGDAVMNLNDRLAPPPAISTPNPRTAQASIHRLADLDFSHLFPSHGPPIFDRGRIGSPQQQVDHHRRIENDQRPSRSARSALTAVSRTRAGSSMASRSRTSSYVN